MAEQKKIRWGILATGRIADWFVADLGAVANGEVAAVASRTQAKADAFAARHGIPRAYGDYRALLTDPDVDIVYVATPHTEHLANATDALRAGKAVLCEKPMTVTPEECRALIAVAEETGGYLMEAMWTYFLPAIRQAEAWVAAGRIGRLRHIKADFGYPLPYAPDRREYDAELGGGALLEMGIYPVALAWLFLRRDPEAIHVTARAAPNGVEDDVVAVFNYADCTATLATSFRCKLRNWAYIIGEEGYIAIPDFWRAGACRLYRLDERVDQFTDDRTDQGFGFEAAAVGGDLLAGKRRPDVVSLADSLKFQEHIARIKALI